MKKKSKLTQEIVRELLDYDPVAGTSTWRHRALHWFASCRSQRSWNARFAGKLAFTTIGISSYGRECYPVSVILCERGHSAHRIAFLYMTGRWSVEVDHKNRNKLDFRWRNLREVTRAQNMQNKDIGKANTSGRVGVRKHHVHGKFEARITVRGKTIQLGVFSAFADAVKAREDGEAKYKFPKTQRSRVAA